MRRTRLTPARAVVAAVPVAALLAGCSLGQGAAPAAPSAGATTPPAGAGVAGGQGSPAAGRVAGVATTVPGDAGSTGTTGSTGTAGTAGATGTTKGAGAVRPEAATSGRPGPQQARDTVRAFLRREVGMREPLVGPLRWTGKDTGEVDVRVRLPEGMPGPVTVVSVRRLRTVWFVSGARTDALRVEAPSGPVPSPVQVRGRAVDPEGDLLVRVTEDRYGPDVELGRARAVVQGDDGRFSSRVRLRPPTRRTGSIVVTEELPRAAGGLVLRATVVRVALTPAPAGTRPSCDPADMLALVKPWFDDARVGLSVARVDVERCRNGYAQVHVVPRNDPGSPSAFDSVELFLQARDGRWHGLDFGTDVGCGSTPTAEVAKACKALGYGS